jgi:hypothetical protein
MIIIICDCKLFIVQAPSYVVIIKILVYMMTLGAQLTTVSDVSNSGITH